jgi:hypothetical protein
MPTGCRRCCARKMRLEGRSPAKLMAWIALLVALVLPGEVQASPVRRAQTNCRSGRTVFREGGTRAFVVVRQFRPGSGEPSAPYKTFYVCRPGSRTPLIFSQGEPYTIETISGFRVFGDRLGFVARSEGIQSGSETEVGWIDLRIGQVRTGVINASEGLANESEEQPGLPRVPDWQVKYAIANDGTVAVLGEGGEPREWEVCLLPVKLHSLGPPRQLFLARAGQEGLDPDSIAISETRVLWTTKNGQPASAPR